MTDTHFACLLGAFGITLLRASLLSEERLGGASVLDREKYQRRLQHTHKIYT